MSIVSAIPCVPLVDLAGAQLGLPGDFGEADPPG
jgi:hypothetical protein